MTPDRRSQNCFFETFPRSTPHSAAVSLLRTVSDLQLILENIFNGNSMVCGEAGVEAGLQRCKNVSCAVMVCLGKIFSPSAFEDAPAPLQHLSEKRPLRSTEMHVFQIKILQLAGRISSVIGASQTPSQLPMSPSAGSSKCHASHTSIVDFIGGSGTDELKF